MILPGEKGPYTINKIIKMVMRYKKSFFLALLIVTFKAQAQFNWPEDRATAEEKNAFYTDNMKSGNYKATIPALQWLMNNAPDLNPSIYINGAKIYEGYPKINFQIFFFYSITGPSASQLNCPIQS